MRYSGAKIGGFQTQPALKVFIGSMSLGQSGLASCLLIGLVLNKTPGATSQRSLARPKIPVRNEKQTYQRHPL